MPGGQAWVIRSRKADETSLLAWLAYADPALAGLRNLGTLPDLGDDVGFGSMIARVFCVETWRAIQTTGLLRAYRRQTVESAMLRGRIDFRKLARKGGDASRTPCTVFSRLPHTPLNRLLAAALRRIERDVDLRRVAGGTRAPLSALLAEIPPGVEPGSLKRPIELSRIEQPFEAAAALARLLLRDASIIDGEEISSLSFLVDVAQLYERTIVRACLDAGLEVIPKHAVPVYRHAVDGRSRHAVMAIDVFLPALQGGPVVVDAKYKHAISSANLQQMITYCWATQARRAVLVVPAGLDIDRRPYSIHASTSGEVIQVDVAEFMLGARSLAGWHDAGRALVEGLLARGTG